MLFPQPSRIAFHPLLKGKIFDTTDSCCAFRNVRKCILYYYLMYRACENKIIKLACLLLVYLVLNLHTLN